MQPILLIAALHLLVAAVPVYRGFTAGRPARVADWAARHGLPLGGDNAPVVARHLRRSRRCRATGAVAGLVAGTAVVNGTQANGLLTFAFLLFGYLGGVTRWASWPPPARSRAPAGGPAWRPVSSWTTCHRQRCGG